MSIRTGYWAGDTVEDMGILEMREHAQVELPVLPEVADQSMPVEAGICRSLAMSGIDGNGKIVTNNTPARKPHSMVSGRQFDTLEE
jgi:hypothetical protein